jgi:cell division septum initiation protein DivIVA
MIAIAPILKHWRLIATGLALAALGIALLLAKADARHWKKRAGQEQAAHAMTVANYKAAQTAAEARQSANLARVAQDQQRITDDAKNAYNRALADARAKYDRLRSQGNRSTPGNAVLPTAGQGASGTAETPGQDGFLADALLATEQALQLDALITWVEAQSAVSTSPVEPR